MSDDAPQNPRLGLPPVRMALRVKGRHTHHGGPHLARAVSEARAPRHRAGSTRLTQHPPAPEAPAPAQPAAAPAASATPYPVPPFLSEGIGEEIAREPAAGGPARPAVPELSSFASEFLFGDAGAASAGLTPMSAAERLPEADT